jgi:hypothetical protein
MIGSLRGQTLDLVIDDAQIGVQTLQSFANPVDLDA